MYSNGSRLAPLQYQPRFWGRRQEQPGFSLASDVFLNFALSRPKTLARTCISNRYYCISLFPPPVHGTEAKMASAPGPVMEFLGRVAYELHLMKPLLPTYLHLLVSAIFPIYTAAHASLSRPSSASAPERKKGHQDEDEDEDEDQIQKDIQSLTPSDAIVFPLLAGTMLASLYFIIKWLQDPAWLNWALGLYFSQVGLFFAVLFLRDTFSVVRSFLLPNEYSQNGAVWKADNQRSCFQADGGKTIGSPPARTVWACSSASMDLASNMGHSKASLHPSKARTSYPSCCFC